MRQKNYFCRLSTKEYINLLQQLNKRHSFGILLHTKNYYLLHISACGKMKNALILEITIQTFGSSLSLLSLLIFPLLLPLVPLCLPPPPPTHTLRHWYFRREIPICYFLIHHVYSLFRKGYKIEQGFLFLWYNLVTM